MKEETRKEIINEIQREINEKDSLESMYKRLNKLTKNPFVVKYLQLLNDINEILKDIKIQLMERQKILQINELKEILDVLLVHILVIIKFGFMLVRIIDILILNMKKIIL